MVAHGRVELLAHPLSQKYLQMKWNSYGKYFHMANLMLYCIFLFFITIFSQQLMYANQTDGRFLMSLLEVNQTENTSYNASMEATATHQHEDRKIQVSMWMYVSGTAILIYTLGSALKEILQAYQQKWHYLFEPHNALSWILYIAAVIMIVPVFNGVACPIHYSAASLSIFFSWFNLLLLLQRFDQVSFFSIH